MAHGNGPRSTRAPRTLRLTLQVLERTAPARAAVLAEKLWFAVPPLAPTSRAARVTPSGGAPFFLMSGSSEISGQSFGPDKGPLALLVHGWGGHWQQLAAHIPALVEAGYRVVAWDAPSHGRSTHSHLGQGRSSVLELTQALVDVVDQMGTPSLVLAHSIGAMATLRAMRQRDLGGQFVFFAPDVRLEPALDWFAGAVGMGPRTRELMTGKVLDDLGLDLAGFDLTRDVRRLAEQDMLPGLLVVHDLLDPDSPFAEGERLCELWPGAELVRTEGLGHRAVIWDKEVVQKVAEHIAALPEPRPRGPRGLG